MVCQKNQFTFEMRKFGLTYTVGFNEIKFGQIWLSIQNKTMDISFQKTLVFSVLDIKMHSLCNMIRIQLAQYNK